MRLQLMDGFTCDCGDPAVDLLCNVGSDPNVALVRRFKQADFDRAVCNHCLDEIVNSEDEKDFYWMSYLSWLEDQPTEPDWDWIREEREFREEGF